MSANPQAFEFLRKSAYNYAQKHGKDAQELRQHCIDALDAWLRGEGTGCDLSSSEAVALAEDVSYWVSRNYRKPKRKALRRREERAAQAALAPMFLEDAAEAGLKPSVRNAARLAGRSKSTMARHLRLQGIAPVRDRKIDALPARSKHLARILDSSFPIDGSWLVQADHCIAKLWDDLDDLPEAIPRSTRSERRKKLPILLAAITEAGIGFNILVRGDVIAIRRGRRFRGMKDAATWIEEEKTINGFRLLRSSEANSRKKRFWDDRWLSDVVDVLFAGAACRTFTTSSQLEPWLRLLRPLLDPRPLVALIDAAVRGAIQDDFVRDLRGLTQAVVDNEVRKAAYQLASLIETVHRNAEGWELLDYFDDLDYELRFMKHLAADAPESHAKLAYFRNVVLPEVAAACRDAPNPIFAAMKRCKSFRDEERSGAWVPPTAKEMAALLASKETASGSLRVPAPSKPSRTERLSGFL